MQDLLPVEWLSSSGARRWRPGQVVDAFTGFDDPLAGSTEGDPAAQACARSLDQISRDWEISVMKVGGG